MKKAYLVVATATLAVLLTAIHATHSHASPCRSYDHGGMTNGALCSEAALVYKLTKPSKRYTRQRMHRRYTPPRIDSPIRSRMIQQQVAGHSYTLHASYGARYHAGPKPGRWCGWWMRTQFGGGPEYNRAWAWSKRGVAASPHVGAVVVWRHHVGYIAGMNSKGQWLVKSGNDGNAVRTRARSLKGAVIRAI